MAVRHCESGKREGEREERRRREGDRKVLARIWVRKKWVALNMERRRELGRNGREDGARDTQLIKVIDNGQKFNAHWGGI